MAKSWSKGLPGARALRTYQRAWLRADLVAGVALIAVLLPQGMAYAELAGLPAATGLYASIAALTAYAVFGPSRVLMLGPDSSLAPLIAAALLPAVAGNGDEIVVLASMLGVLVGVICLLIGLARLGSITELLSRPVRIGYINGIAVIVLVSQLPKLFGFSTDDTGIVDQVGGFLAGLAQGDADPLAAAIGIGSLVVILGAGRISPAVPGVLVAVVGSTLLANMLGTTAADLAMVGALPAGLPGVDWPGVDLGTARSLLLAAVGIAIVAFADTATLSSTFATRTDDTVDPNEEILALGAANVAAGLFHGFPVSASSSRTTVAVASGTKTQLAGLVGAAGLVVLLLFAEGLLAKLPSATLAAIVVAASLFLFDLGEVRWLWRVRRSELVLSVAATLGVVLAGPLEGVVIAVALSLGNFIRRAWRPYDAVLGRIEGLRGYHDVDRHPEAEMIPGLVVFRFDSPLFFANAEHFERRLATVLREASPPVRWVIIAAEPVTDIDTTAAAMLSRVLDGLGGRGVRLVFAELKGPVKDRLRSYGLYDRVGDDGFFPTLGVATTAYVEETGIEWVDWTDQ